MTKDTKLFISRKIQKLLDEGYSGKQAIAIAFSMARTEGHTVPKANPQKLVKIAKPLRGVYDSP
jgi:hypothetical protein